MNNNDFRKEVTKIKPIKDFIEKFNPELPAEYKILHAEFVLHALAEFSVISKKGYQGSFNFNDMLNSMLG